VPLQQVLDGMQSGEIASKLDSGFTFVDVAPDSPVFEPLRKQTPPTYAVVSHEELVALSAEEEQSIGAAREEAEKLRRPPLAA
jgi:hypothetical protein